MSNNATMAEHYTHNSKLKKTLKPTINHSRQYLNQQQHGQHCIAVSSDSKPINFNNVNNQTEVTKAAVAIVTWSAVSSVNNCSLKIRNSINNQPVTAAAVVLMPVQ